METCKRCGSKINLNKCQGAVPAKDAVTYSRGTGNLEHLHYRICQHILKKPADLERPCLLNTLSKTGQVKYNMSSTPTTPFK